MKDSAREVTKIALAHVIGDKASKPTGAATRWKSAAS